MAQHATTQQPVTLERVTAVFENHAHAEAAVAELRKMGITDNQLSFVARRNDELDTTGHGKTAEKVESKDSTGERVGKGALAGGATGLLLGLGAAAIPGIGPFITAGYMAEALGVVGGAAVSGTVVGGTTGAVAGAFAKAGYDEKEAQYYGSAVERGNILVAVDTKNSPVSAEKVHVVLKQHGGSFASTY